MRRPPAVEKPARTVGWVSWLALTAACVGGCDIDKRLVQSESQLGQCRQENTTLKADLRSSRQVVARQKERIRTLQGLGQRRLELLFHVTGVKLGRYTAGVNLDGKDGDDGVRVYLRPVDRDGHAIKAAGAVTIRLFDLGAAPPENLLAEYKYPVEKIAEHWAAGFMTYHYRFDCPWKSGPPKNPEITVRVAFTDYLTGKTFSAQKPCQVRLAPKSK